MLIVPLDESESEKRLCDDVTTFFIVKKYGQAIKLLSLEWRLV